MTPAEVVAKQGELLLVRRNGEGAVYNTLTDELSEWLDLQIWFKFGVYEEIDPYPFEGAIEKGGPGSGYFGHGGRPGQRGGSASLSAGHPGVVELDKNVHKLTRGKYPKLTDDEMAGIGLEAAAGVHRGYYLALESDWSGNSTTGLAVLEIQEAVEAEFDIKMPSWQKEQLVKHRETLEDWPEGKEKPEYLRSTIEEAQGSYWGRGQTSEQLLGEHKDTLTANRAVVRAMYNKTQETLTDMGVEEVTLYRGVRVGALGESIAQGAQIALSGNGSISSWAVKELNAKRFAGKKNKTAQIEAKGGFVTRMTVPKERIFSTARTGFGLQYENEMVILRGSSDVAQITKTYSK